MKLKRFLSGCAIAVLVASAGIAEETMWGFTPDRNLVSDAKNLPTSWNVETGENIVWKADLGAQSYAGPIRIGGKIFMGTNNQIARNPKITGDKGRDHGFSGIRWKISLASSASQAARGARQ